ncbi:MAG: ATP-binding protein [Candidatus Thermoplasmatota archaeon]|nr:ATP-binding protein [Candidatus Thermoplasmatota archaeon]
MKQLTVISGKGGTGKTTIVAAFASFAKNAVLADCDVDAADLHLILKPEVLEKRDFMGLKIAKRDASKCTSCGLCLEHCRFHAVSPDYSIISSKCEGCAVCELVCPSNAIEMVDRLSGFSYISTTRHGPMAHAELKTAEEASGKLVTVVRTNAKLLAKKEGRELIIIDGPPGIGCPVISAIAGVDLVLIVTEPTLSGMHDLGRILDVAAHFKVPAVVCVNKSDINPENVASIEEYCSRRGVEALGKLPYDDSATRAMIEGKSVVEFAHGALADSIADLWVEVEKRLWKQIFK